MSLFLACQVRRGYFLARDEVLMSEISRLRRRRTLYITEGEDNFTFELHRSSPSAAARSSDTQRFIYADFPHPWVTGAQTANWGWYDHLDQSCDDQSQRAQFAGRDAV